MRWSRLAHHNGAYQSNKEESERQSYFDHARAVCNEWANCVARQLKSSRITSTGTHSSRTARSVSRNLRLNCEESEAMNYLAYLTDVPGQENSRIAQFGRRLVTIAFALKALNGIVATVLLMTVGVLSVSAQTPTGSFFNGNSSQLGNSLRSVTFFLA